MKTTFALCLFLVPALTFGQEMSVGIVAPIEYSTLLDRVQTRPELSLHARFDSAPLDVVVSAQLQPLILGNTGSLGAGLSVDAPWTDGRLELLGGLGGNVTFLMGTQYSSFARLGASYWHEVNFDESPGLNVGVGFEVQRNLTHTYGFYRGELLLLVPITVELRLN